MRKWSKSGKASACEMEQISNGAGAAYKHINEGVSPHFIVIRKKR
jgi:hypothetical protein